MAPVVSPDGTPAAPPTPAPNQDNPLEPSPSPAPSPTPAPAPNPAPRPGPSVNDFAGFSAQASVGATSAFAAAPPTIDLNFGGGSSIATIQVPRNFLAEGTIVAGAPGSANADISFDLTPQDFVPDLLSVGTGRDDLNTGDGVETFDVVEDVPGGTLAPPAGTTFESATATRTAGTGSFVDGELWDISAIFTQQVEIPNPSSIVVGRLKIGENSSPMPRNRVFFNYSYFNDVRLRAEGVDVHRFSPGFEMMLGDKTSVEVRTPFASTLSSSFALDGLSTTSAEFGDIFVVFKRMIAQTENTLWSVGLGVTLPTADDLEISVGNNVPLIRVQNTTIHLQPFVGYMFLLTDRLFAQGFLQLDIDARGNRVFINPLFESGGTNPVSAGTIKDTTNLFSDVALGYWIRKRGEHREKLLTSIVPMLEYHYSRSLESNDVVGIGAVTLGQAGDGVQRNTIVAGCHFGVRNVNNITLGYAAPVGNRTDQAFDGELRCFWNRYF